MGVSFSLTCFERLLEEDVIGNGEEKIKLERFASERDIDESIKFLGRKNINDISTIAKNADLFVMSSHTKGVPISMLEAMVFGLPIVSTSVGGIPSLVSSCLNGYLVNERDKDIFADAILKALNFDKTKSAEYGRNLVEKFYSARSIVNEMFRAIS